MLVRYSFVRDAIMGSERAVACTCTIMPGALQAM